MTQATCNGTGCSNPAVNGALCASCSPPGTRPPLRIADETPREAEFNAFLSNPLGAPKADPVPDEATEAFARNMRMTYLAMVGQGFTEDQALKIVSHVIRGIFGTLDD